MNTVQKKYSHTHKQTNKPAVAIFYYCFDPNNKMVSYGFNL